MSKLYVNYNSLDQNVLSDLNNALKQLTKSIYDIGTINVPYNFEYAQYVKNIFDKNSSSYNKLLKKKNKLEKIISTYKLVEKNNSELIRKIKIVDINYRKNIVN